MKNASCCLHDAHERAAKVFGSICEMQLGDAVATEEVQSASFEELRVAIISAISPRMEGGVPDDKSLQLAKMEVGSASRNLRRRSPSPRLWRMRWGWKCSNHSKQR